MLHLDRSTQPPHIVVHTCVIAVPYLPFLPPSRRLTQRLFAQTASVRHPPCRPGTDTRLAQPERGPLFRQLSKYAVIWTRFGHVTFLRSFPNPQQSTETLFRLSEFRRSAGEFSVSGSLLAEYNPLNCHTHLTSKGNIKATVMQQTKQCSVQLQLLPTPAVLKWRNKR